MNKILAKQLTEQFQFVLKGEIADEILDNLESWHIQFHEDYTTLASCMVEAFKDFIYDFAEDMDDKESDKVVFLKF